MSSLILRTWALVVLMATAAACGSQNTATAPASTSAPPDTDEQESGSYYGRESFDAHELSALVPTQDDLSPEWGWFLGFELTEPPSSDPTLHAERADPCDEPEPYGASSVVFVQWVAAPAGPRNDFPPGDVPSISVELTRGSAEANRAFYQARTALITCPSDDEPAAVVTTLDPPDAPGTIEATRLVQSFPGEPDYQDNVIVLHDDFVYHFFVVADADAPAAAALDVESLVTTAFERYESNR